MLHNDHKKEDEQNPALSRSHELCFLALDHIDKGVMVVDEDYQILRCNDAFCDLTGLDKSDLDGAKVEDYLDCYKDSTLDLALQELFAGKNKFAEKTNWPVAVKVSVSKNIRNLLSCSIRSVATGAGEILAFIYFEENTESSLPHSEFPSQLENYQRAMFDSAFDAIVIFNRSGEIKDINKSFAQLFDCQSLDEATKNLRQYIPELMETIDRGKSFYETLLNDNYREIDGIDELGQKISLDLVIRQLEEVGELLFFASLRDNSARKKAEANLVQAVRFDSLTGLANRAYLREELQKRIKIGQRYQRKFGLLFVDLDRFKNINDALGAQAGDELLKEVARRVKDSVRDTDLVARLGGDEFCVILEDLAKPESAKIVVNKILTSMNKPFKLQDMELKVGVSIGITIYPQDGEDEDTLTKHADAAMQEAKSQGLSSFCFFNHAMNQHAAASIAVENDLRRSIQQSHLIPYYQPQIDLNTGKIIGVESLIRWRHPNQGMVLPGNFIPIAEETGLIVELGKISIIQGMKDSSYLKSHGISSIKTSINLSPKQFRDENLVPTLRTAILENNLNPKDVVLEITEGHLVEASGERCDQVLIKLKELGVLIAIDDFGTGYSSFSYLKNLPIDIVKIDRSFVNGAENDPNARNLVSGIIDIIHGLGMSVVAEGVENKSQAELLKNEGCEVVQGFYFGKPMPLNDLVEWYSKFEFK